MVHSPRPSILAALLAGAMISPCAHAYLDPGTGSVLLQGLLAGAAGVAIVARLYWTRLKRSLGRLLGRKHSPVPADRDSHDPDPRSPPTA